MMQITPNDVAHLPDRVGKMVFDRTQMKWVKAPEDSDIGLGLASAVNESEDPFKDIESIRGDDSSRKSVTVDDVEDEDDDRGVVSMDIDQSRLEEDPSDSDAEEAELTSFSCDYTPRKTSSNARGVERSAHDAASDEPTDTTGRFTSIALDSDSGVVQEVTDTHKLAEPALQDTPPHLLAPASTRVLATPLAPSQASQNSRPSSVVRSALKQNTATPVSALKDRTHSKMSTPANQIGHRRSVSFSDGKRDGPIVGIGRNVPTPDGTLESDDDAYSDLGGPGPSTAASMPSARSKRIAGMLEGLEDTCKFTLCRVWRGH